MFWTKYIKILELCIHKFELYSFQWVANPVNDMYADAVLAVILQVESNPTSAQGDCHCLFVRLLVFEILLRYDLILFVARMYRCTCVLSFRFIFSVNFVFKSV